MTMTSEQREDNQIKSSQMRVELSRVELRSRPTLTIVASHASRQRALAGPATRALARPKACECWTWNGQLTRWLANNSSYVPPLVELWQLLFQLINLTWEMRNRQCGVIQSSWIELIWLCKRRYWADNFVRSLPRIGISRRRNASNALSDGS